MKTRLTSVTYLGFTAMDRRFSNAMLPWLLKEIRTTSIRDKLSVAIEDGCLKAYNGNFEPVIVHRLVDIIRASQVPGVPEELFYMLLNEKEGLLNCYLFRASTVQDVTDLFQQMREPSPGAASPRGSTSSLINGSVTKNIGFQQLNSSEHLPWNSQTVASPGNCSSNLSTDCQSPLVRSTSNASALTSLCADLSPSDSHFFEVLYIGKVRISQRKVPDTLIDDALTKFAQHEAEKAKNSRRHSLLSSTGTSVYSNDSTENLEDKKNEGSTKKINITPSTTPLEPHKSWQSVENLIHAEKRANSSEIDQEFDMFSKERLEKNGHKQSQNEKESIAVFNVQAKNNLHTLKEDEEKNEDVNSMISDTASSITQFCQTNFLKTVEQKEQKIVDQKQIVTNKNIDSKSIHTEEVLVNKSDSSLVEQKDLLKNKAVNKTEENTVKDQNENTAINISNSYNNSLEAKSNNNLESSHVPIESINELKTERKFREDSPASSVSFEGVSSKPKVFLRSKTGLDAVRSNALPENKPFLRDRSASIGTLNLKTPIAQLIGEQNRTMLFQIGRAELRLISPDRKQILLHRAFKDVASCVLGRVNKDHFGFVCRETNDTYACYVFKCESDSVATEVINAIKQAFVAHADLLKKSREKSPNMTCEHCPMLWYHRLCHDTEGMNEKKIHAFILRRIEQLPDDEQDLIITKYQGGTNHMYETNEHNSFLMMLLRAHCEGKQQRHVHDTAENRSEFLNQYLGGSTIFMKAKRSLSSGFDHLLKRKANQLEAQPKKEASPVPTPVTPMLETSSETSAPELLTPDTTEPPPSPKPLNIPPPEEERDETKESTPVNSPMMDIFLKVSDSRPSVTETGDESDATWRQAIYEKVVQPTDNQEGELTPKNLLGLPSAPPGKRTKEQLRQLWKMAIDQTILLVRMEKENARLKESEQSSAVRRIKLEYSELGSCDTGVIQMWETLLARRDASQPSAKVDRHMLTQAVIQGVPRMSRGGVWYFLAEQACLRGAPPDVRAFPNYHTPYRTLLAGLTKHQHAILIDLGRTFPQHSYFASALGPGQLALYNLLKAYSLLDPDVGYCQGLSFVAGVLLLHMDEADAFILLRHLMFRRGLRKQYLPDMSALQVQLYQLSRLLRDHEPELHAKLESLDISPALYAAPWMLTLFTSQFPLGFVVRIFDLIFLESMEVVFAVSLALLSAHKDGLMLCESCEEAAEYLKHKLPDIDKGLYEKVMRKVHSLDISRQLVEYAVEYAVLREEMPRLAAMTEDNRRLITDARKMAEDLDSAMDAITNYQQQQSRLESANKTMEQHLTLLSRYISAHYRQDMPIEIKKIVHTYSKKISFGHKISSFSSKFTLNEDDEGKSRSGVSSPNLFSKISRDEVLNAYNKDKSSPENDRRGFMMKKSQSIHSGLIAKYPPKVTEETEVDVRKQSNNIEGISESLKELRKKSFATTEEEIQQERMFEHMLKHNFDENLKKLDQKIAPQSYINDLSVFQSRRSMSLNLSTKQEIKSDSGFVTPLTPNDDKKDDSILVISHPLSDCDVDIKFDGHSTKLKQIRPIKQNGNTTDTKQM